jgi:hypothetical protein
MGTLARLGGLGKQAAEVNGTIALNDTDSEIEKARFNYQTKLFALQNEFNTKRDGLRTEYHAALAEITGEE